MKTTTWFAQFMRKKEGAEFWSRFFVYGLCKLQAGISTLSPFLFFCFAAFSASVSAPLLYALRLNWSWPSTWKISPKKSPEPYKVAAIHPDRFVASLIETNPEAAHLAAKRQWQSLRNPPKSLGEFLETLENNGLKGTAERLKIFFDEVK